MARSTTTLRQAGMALPVMLIILLVMMITGIYMLRATHSSELSTGNLAYNATMARAVDYGLHVGFQYLSTTAAGNKGALNSSDAPHGYEAKLDTTRGVRDAAFWNNAITVTDPADPDKNQVDFVIHRMCAQELRYDDKGNSCMMTSANTAQLGNSVPLGASLAADAPQFADSPQVHYVITARIHGARGGNVVNQMIVLIGV
ncbi:pilus assembly PilX N-terminal domain-containing protein [Massilia sp. 9096]|uniref:pilus assembly PilX family protein n=1 Tax=Massilia sp. 9096 TaxID=1500894 RepID=UPI000689ED50|nr:pilus assembly PilX N-terminal domain-containing protein [Massilia sp. 9096]